MAEKNMAPVLKRIVAAIIDGVLLGIVTTVVNMLLGLHVAMGASAYMAGGGYGALDGIYMTLLFSGVIATAIGIGYFAYFEGGPKQASVGKSLLGLRVVKADGGLLDQKLAAKRAGILYSFYLISLLLPFSLGILKTLVNLGGLYAVGLILFNDQRQGLHDKVCKTYVVQA